MIGIYKRIPIKLIINTKDNNMDNLSTNIIKLIFRLFVSLFSIIALGSIIISIIENTSKFNIITLLIIILSVICIILSLKGINKYFK